MVWVLSTAGLLESLGSLLPGPRLFWLVGGAVFGIASSFVALAASNLLPQVIQGHAERTAERLAIYRARMEREERSGLWPAVADFAWLIAVQHLGDDPIAAARSEIEDQGFDRLDENTFEKGEAKPENCWRREFTLLEVRKEWPVDRQRLARSGEDRQSVTEEVIETIEDGGAQAVLGPPGSGKSTTCKSVAIQWYERSDLGSVFYFERSELDDPAGLAEQLEMEEKIGTPLVVVEDVTRTPKHRIFETVQTLAEAINKLDVAFLFDSRSHEWEGFDERMLRMDEEESSDDARAMQGKIPPCRMPRLDKTEVERVFERFAQVTERSQEDLPDPGSVYDRVRIESEEETNTDRPEASEMLLLSYYLPVAGMETPDLQSKDSSLVENVKMALEEVKKLSEEETVEPGEATLVERVALLVNLLNAVGIDVHREYVYALADGEDFAAVQSQLSDLSGTIHFGTREDGPYWVNHEVWSVFYLTLFLERFEGTNGLGATREVFWDCLSNFFSITDENRLEQLSSERTTSPLFDDDGDPGETADEHVVAVFEFAAERPAFADYFGSSYESDIRLPETASLRAKLASKIQRAEMFRKTEDRALALPELDAAREEAEETGVDADWIEAVYANHRGHVAFSRGNYQEAREHLQRILEFEDEVPASLVAASLGNLGLLERRQGDYEQAELYHHQSLEIHRELGNRQGEANQLGNLGAVAQQQGDYEQAEQYHHQSLEIERELGNRQGEAKSLGNLGVMAQQQGDYEQAEQYHHQSLEILRELGNRQGEAKQLGSLALVAHQVGDYEVAREYHERSLEIERELGNVAGVASELNNLGNIALEQEKYEDAREFCEDAAEIFREIGAVARLLKAYGNLVRVCIQQGDEDSAVEVAEKAISAIEESDIPGLADRRKQFEAILAQLGASD